MFIRKDHLNMIKQLAWSFYQTTGLNYEELYSTACLEWCEAMLSYKPSRGASLKTYGYVRTKKRLLNYIKKEQRDRMDSLEIIGERANFTPSYEFFAEKQTDVQKVFKMILLEIEKFEDISPDMAKNLVRRKLKEEMGWTWPRVWDAIRDSKEFLKHNEVNCII